MRRRDRGFALLLVLGAVAILSALAVELASRSNVQVMLASRTVRDASFRRLFDSGVEVARAMLSEPEALPWDSWGDPWNGEVAFDLSPGERVRVRVADESGKINIARAVSTADERPRIRRMLARLFEYLAAEEPGSARNWKDLEERVLGRLGLLARSEPPSPEPLLTLDGLRDAGIEQGDVFGERGLARYLTAFGDGKINLNTAPRAVLYALDPEFDRAIVERIARYRGKGEGERGEYRAFEKPSDLELVDGVVTRTLEDGRPKILRNLYAKVSQDVTTQSSSFSARMAGESNSHRREAWAFFEARRMARPGEPPRRETRKLVLEEILP